MAQLIIAGGTGGEESEAMILTAIERLCFIPETLAASVLLFTGRLGGGV